jgi:hypothetical protein
MRQGEVRGGLQIGRDPSEGGDLTHGSNDLSRIARRGAELRAQANATPGAEGEAFPPGMKG